jgi:FKBP-type peptidyl-prolyl cis-trans isomerase SlyD
MKIEKEKYVSIDYELTVDDEVVDKSEPGQPLGFVSGIGQIVPGLDNAIQGKEAGDDVEVTFSAEEGYGEVREELLQELPKTNFPDDLELEAGLTFQAQTPHGPVSFKVAEVKDDVVVADLNHPLAGKDLHFSVKIAEVRDATEEELAPSCDGSHECHSCSHSH